MVDWLMLMTHLQSLGFLAKDRHRPGMLIRNEPKPMIALR